MELSHRSYICENKPGVCGKNGRHFVYNRNIQFKAMAEKLDNLKHLSILP